MEHNDIVSNAETKIIDSQKLTPVLSLLENSIKIWWKYIIKFIRVYLWGLSYSLIPIAIIFIILFLNVWQGTNIIISFRVLLFIISIASVVAIIYFAIRSQAAIFLLVKNNYTGNELHYFKETKKLAIPYIILTVLTVVLIMLWALLLIIPGIIFSILYSLAVFAFFFEDRRGLEAIKRSRELIKGYFWPVVGRYLFLALIFWLFYVILGSPLSTVAKHSFFWEVWSFFMQIVDTLIGVVALLFSYQIYQDLVRIKK